MYVRLSRVRESESASSVCSSLVLRHRVLCSCAIFSSCNNNNRYFFIYKLLAPPINGVRSQLVQGEQSKELQSKAG